MCAEGFGINGVETLTAGHEEAITARAAETDVAANFWKNNLSNTLAFRRENVNAIITFANPTGAGPDVAVSITADAIGETGDFLSVEIHLHGSELTFVPEFRFVYVPNLDVLGRFRIVACAGVGDVNFLVIGGKAETVGFKNFVSDFVEFTGVIQAIDGFLEK